jgi:hypothetical protein
MSSSSKPPEKTTSASINLIGMPGEPGDLVAINRFKGTDPRNNAPLQGAPGDYQVTFVLCRPGYKLLPETEVSFATGLTGDSHLAITKPAFTPPGNPDADQIKIYGRTEDGVFTFTGYPNKKGFLGKLISDPFKALDRQDAKRKAYRALAPSLSNWSVHLDIPLEVFQVDCTEISTGNSQVSHTNPYWEVPFAITPTAELKANFRGYAGLYREALASSSTVYRFLCFYKIIEGLRARRKRLERDAKKKGIAIGATVETLPKDAPGIAGWLNAIFPILSGRWDPMAIDSSVPPEVRGQEISDVIEKILKPLRGNIAHALSDESEELTMNADELLHTQQVNKWLGLTKCIVRRMLKNDFPGDFLSYLREDGTIIAG